MRDLLRRLFVREERVIVGDLAKGDWTPPPPGETGSTDWARWINEELPRPKARPSVSAPGAELPHLTLPSALADRSDDIVGTWAEPLELELVTEEVIEGQPVPEPVAPPVPEPVPTGAPRRRRATLGGGRARIRTPLPERRWRDVLSGYAEHLTDEELAIIRAQIGK